MKLIVAHSLILSFLKEAESTEELQDQYFRQFKRRDFGIEFLKSVSRRAPRTRDLDAACSHPTPTYFCSVRI